MTEMALNFKLHTDDTAFTLLEADWNDLLARSTTRVPFLRAEYQRAWWIHRGGGEWPEARLCVITARDATGQLVGIAPLFAARNRDQRPALLLLGSIEISDYLDLVVDHVHTAAFCAGLLDRLHQPDVPAWEVLDFYNLPRESPTRAVLAQAAQARGWTATETTLEPVPAIPLPDDWEVYLQTMVEKKERTEIRRKIRRAERNEEHVAWYVVDATHDLAAETEAFMTLMALNPDKARFLTPAMRAQFHDTVQAAFAHGWLHMAFLTVNGEKAAAYLNFDFGNVLYIYNSAIDPRFGALSVGWVLLGYLIKWAIDHKRAMFDFMRGSEDYKLRFGGVPETIFRVQIARDLPREALGGEPACMMNEFEKDFFPG